MPIVILSGRSGSGKSVALRALEDQGYYCVDNMPVSLLPELVAIISAQHSDLAFGIDARNSAEELAQFDTVYDMLWAQYERPTVIFADADDSTLQKRFSETRRRHPLTHVGISLNEAIAHERELLNPIALRADLLVDTTLLSAAKLRQLILDRVLHHQSLRMDLLFESFGYKTGLPTDADFAFDARCLPNPYWDAQLRPYSGRDQPIIDFLGHQDMVKAFIEQIIAFLDNWLTRFEQDNRSYLTVAIGCTGGQHRSVYVAEQLAAHYRTSRPYTQVRHRDLHSTTS